MKHLGTPAEAMRLAMQAGMMMAEANMVIAMRIGESPTKKLEQKGIKVFTTYDRIENAVKLAAKELINI